MGSRDGAVVRTLALHQCGPGSISELGAICQWNLLLVLVLTLKFLSWCSGFPVSSGINISEFHFDLESVPNYCSALDILIIEESAYYYYFYNVPRQR